jgi:hypothetical protein
VLAVAGWGLLLGSASHVGAEGIKRDGKRRAVGNRCVANGLLMAGLDRDGCVGLIAWLPYGVEAN